MDWTSDSTCCLQDCVWGPPFCLGLAGGREELPHLCCSQTLSSEGPRQGAIQKLVQFCVHVCVWVDVQVYMCVGINWNYRFLWLILRKDGEVPACWSLYLRCLMPGPPAPHHFSWSPWGAEGNITTERGHSAGSQAPSSCFYHRLLLPTVAFTVWTQDGREQTGLSSHS